MPWPPAETMCTARRRSSAHWSIRRRGCSTRVAAPAAWPSGWPRSGTTWWASTSTRACWSMASEEAPDLDWRVGDLAELDTGQLFDVVLVAGNTIPLLEPGTLESAASHLAAQLDEERAAGLRLRPGCRPPARRLPGHPVGRRRRGVRGGRPRAGRQVLDLGPRAVRRDRRLRRDRAPAATPADPRRAVAVGDLNLPSVVERGRFPAFDAAVSTSSTSGGPVPAQPCEVSRRLLRKLLNHRWANHAAT